MQKALINFMAQVYVCAGELLQLTSSSILSGIISFYAVIGAKLLSGQCNTGADDMASYRAIIVAVATAFDG